MDSKVSFDNIPKSVASELAGEIEMQIDDTCGACEYVEPDDDCQICGGNINYKRKLIVTTDVIESIAQSVIKNIIS